MTAVRNKKIKIATLKGCPTNSSIYGLVISKLQGEMDIIYKFLRAWCDYLNTDTKLYFCFIYLEISVFNIEFSRKICSSNIQFY
jgi:hypothetical protein